MIIDHELIRRVMLNEYRRNKSTKPPISEDEWEFKRERERARRRLACKRYRERQKAKGKAHRWVPTPKP